MENPIMIAVLAALFVLMLGVVLFLTFSKKGNKYYDERQIIGRGKAFEAGFFTLLISEFFVSFPDLVDSLPGSFFVWQMAAIGLSMVVFALTAVHFDAYLSMRNTPKQYIVMGCFFTVSALLLARVNFRDGEAGSREVGFLCLMAAVVWVVLVAALLIHNRKKTRDEE